MKIFIGKRRMAQIISHEDKFVIGSDPIFVSQQIKSVHNFLLLIDSLFHLVGPMQYNSVYASTAQTKSCVGLN